MFVARYILILLVLLASWDDALADVTAGADDDALASQNNEYLTRACERARSLLRDLRSSTAHSTRLVRPSRSRFAGRSSPWREESGLDFGPDPLYLLMSLQR